MTEAELDALLLQRRAALATSAAAQVAAIKAAKVGPWKPALVAVKPRKRRPAPKVTPLRRRA